jgi:hypothetical protein
MARPRYLLAAISLLAAQGAFADNGSYEAVTSLTTDYARFEQGDVTVTGGSSSGTQTIIKSTGGLFPERSSTLFACIVYAKKSAGGLDLEASCNSTDSSGDKVFSLARRRVGDVTPGGGWTGSSALQGGTGKFAGITGSCEYKVDVLSANRLVTFARCQWQKS